MRLVVKGSTTTAIRQTKTTFYSVSNLQKQNEPVLLALIF